jgi:hypothetical protein
MESVDLVYRLSLPPGLVFDELADPSYIPRIAPFKVTVTHVRDGAESRYGVGSIRRIKAWFATPYEEEIVLVEPGRLIEYRAVKGTPFNHHHGSYRIEPDGEGTRFAFHMEFSCSIPGLASVMRWLLEPMNRRGFDELVRQLEARRRVE